MYLGKTRLGATGRNLYHQAPKAGSRLWFRRLGHHFWIGSIILMIMGGLAVTLMVGYLVALSAPFFRLEDVSIQGNKRVTQLELLQKGGLEDKTNILSLNLSNVKKKMEGLPWIQSVQLRRELPNKLVIQVKEREPLSLVLFQQGLFFMDREGFPFKKAERQETNTLPVLTGLGSDQWQEGRRLDPRILEEVHILTEGLARGKEPLYPDKLSEIHYDPDCGYTLYTLDRGIRIALGQNDLKTRLSRLDRLWTGLQKRPDLHQLRGISLQYGKRVIVHGVRPAGGFGKS